MNKRYTTGLIKLQRKALGEKGGDLQRNLLENAKKEGDDFIEWLDDKIAYFMESGETNVVEGTRDIPIPEAKITAGELLNPPENVMTGWYEIWKKKEVVPLTDASSPGFWAYVTRRMIEEEKILPRYLAMGAGTGSRSGMDAGLDYINKALSSGPQEMDACVRNFFRHFCGVHDRGTRSLYGNCCLASAWWKCHVSAATGEADWQNKILPVAKNPTVWEQLTDKMASKLTILGDENIRSGLLQFLASSEGKKHRVKNSLNALLLRIGAVTSWCAIGFLTPQEVRDEIAKIAEDA